MRWAIPAPLVLAILGTVSCASTGLRAAIISTDRDPSNVSRFTVVCERSGLWGKEEDCERSANNAAARLAQQEGYNTWSVRFGGPAEGTVARPRSWYVVQFENRTPGNAFSASTQATGALRVCVYYRQQGGFAPARTSEYRDSVVDIRKALERRAGGTAIFTVVAVNEILTDPPSGCRIQVEVKDRRYFADGTVSVTRTTPTTATATEGSSNLVEATLIVAGSESYRESLVGSGWAWTVAADDLAMKVVAFIETNRQRLLR